MSNRVKIINDIFEEVKNKETSLHRVLVVFQSPITGLNYRVAYFNNVPEADLWKSQMKEVYDNLGYDYHIYCDIIVR